MTQEQLRKKLEQQFKKYSDCVFPEVASKMLRLGINTVYHMLKGNLIFCYIVASKYHVAKQDVIDFVLVSGYTECILPTDQRKEIQKYCAKEPRTASEVSRILGHPTNTAVRRCWHPCAGRRCWNPAFPPVTTVTRAWCYINVKSSSPDEALKNEQVCRFEGPVS